MGLSRRANAQRGFTLLDVLFVIALIGLLASLLIPSLGRARGRAQRTSALGTLRLVGSAQLSYAITCGLGFYAPDLPALGAPPQGGSEAFLPPDLSSAATVIRSGYSFSLSATPIAGAPPTCNGIGAGQSASGYAVIADPLDPAINAGFFATNADGTVFEHTASLAGVMPDSGVPPVGSPVR